MFFYPNGNKHYAILNILEKVVGKICVFIYLMIINFYNAMTFYVNIHILLAHYISGTYSYVSHFDALWWNLAVGKKIMLVRWYKSHKLFYVIKHNLLTQFK